MALSTSGAKYTALSLCTREVLWVRSILKDLGQEQVGATEVREEIKEQSHWRATSDITLVKHIDIRHHFIRQNVVNNTISDTYIKTEDQVADMLTKASGTKRLKFMCKANGVKFASTSQ